MHMYEHECICLHMPVHVSMYMWVYVCICMYTNVRAGECMYMCAVCHEPMHKNHEQINNKHMKSYAVLYLVYRYRHTCIIL